MPRTWGQISQDTSAFYLGKIYKFSHHPKYAAICASTPFSVAKPPPFPPPRHTVPSGRIHSSPDGEGKRLVISLICILWATSSQQWRCQNRSASTVLSEVSTDAYILCQCRGQVSQTFEGSLRPLHFSIFLFNRSFCSKPASVFIPVIRWTGLFSKAQGWITLMPTELALRPGYGIQVVNRGFQSSHVHRIRRFAISLNLGTLLEPEELNPGMEGHTR